MKFQARLYRLRLYYRVGTELQVVDINGGERNLSCCVLRMIKQRHLVN